MDALDKAVDVRIIKKLCEPLQQSWFPLDHLMNKIGVGPSFKLKSATYNCDHEKLEVL